MTFTEYFPVPSSVAKKKFVYINIGLSVLIALTAFTPMSVNRAYFEDEHFIREFGPLYALFAVYVVGGAVYMIINTALKYRRLKHYVDKQKVKYVLFGLFAGMLDVVIFMFILPYLGYQELFFIGVTGPLLLVGFTAYAIVRYHALDISMFATRVIVYTVHTIVVASVIHVMVLISRGWARDKNDVMVTLISCLTLGIIFLYIKKIKPFIDNLIQRKAINMSRALEEFSRELNLLKPLDALSLDIQNYMQRILNVDHVSLLLKANADVYCVNSNNEEIVKPMDEYKPFPEYMEKEDAIFSAEQIELDPAYNSIKTAARQFFAEMQADLAIPLLFNKKMLGILLLGKKSDERTYDTLELQLLSIVRHDIGVALNNSRLYQKVNDLYEEVTRLNETLEERVTERTADLQDALTQLKHVDKLKSEFISVASHELRTPLTAVKGAIDLASEYEMDGEVGRVVKHFLEMSSRNIDRLVNLINDILDLSKLEASQTDMIIETVNMNDVILTACDSLETLCESKHIKVAKILPAKQVELEGDRARLTQVVVNLFDNAIKYSPYHSTITVALKEDNGWIECNIKDEGRGISKEDQIKIFEKFGQSQDAEEKIDGTGLGLAIAKQIVENHHGIIWVESMPDQGSVFKFRLPSKN